MTLTNRALAAASILALSAAPALAQTEDAGAQDVRSAANQQAAPGEDPRTTQDAQPPAARFTVDDSNDALDFRQTDDPWRTLLTTPQHPAYDRLLDARDTYQAYVEHGGWPALEGSDVIEEGDSAPEVEALRARLAFTGDLDHARRDPAEEAQTLTPALVEDLREFQIRHGLTEDGLLGPNTRAALNVPAEQRLAQIEANIEHWSEIDVDFGQDYILVNVPEFRVRAYEDGEEVIQMKVIVGAEYGGRTTPSFSDEMEHVIFRPYWMVPPTIATEEVVKKPMSELRSEGFQIVRDYDPNSTPLALTRSNLDAVARGDLRIRQAAGPQNALGRVKFIFPNTHDIYLHDTPADHLFDEAERDFSHGCIRVERPGQLADWVLDRAEENWSDSEISAALNGGERQFVPLETKIPVHILYWTVWADEDGSVNFREDIYNRFGSV